MATFWCNFLCYVEECWFKAFVAELQVAYMGVACQSTTLMEITDCKMRKWNECKVVHLTVFENYNIFMSLVETLNQTKSYPSDICTLYYGCWHDDLKHFAEVEDCAFTERPAGESNTEAWV